MKILLINPPQEKEVHFAVPDDYDAKARSHNPPLGLMYLYSYLSATHEVSIVDMSAKGMKIADMSKILDIYKPHLVGITCVISKWVTVKELAKCVKNHRLSPIVVVGGVNPSLYTYETLQCKDIDFAIRGFGQIPFVKLCDAIWNAPRDGSPLPHIENCFTGKDFPLGRVPGSFAFDNLDCFPLPDRSVLPPHDYDMPFVPENPTTSLLSSLGCPHKCAFCQCRTFGPISIRDANNVVSELQVIRSLGIKSVMVQDELFAMSPARIANITLLMLAKNVLDLHWAIRARANPMKLESLELMKRSGCFNIHMGIESGNPRTLQRMNKKTTVEQIKESVKRVKQAGIGCTASFMLGYPGETKEEIMDTINLAEELELKACQFYITIPSPGTQLYREWQDNSGYEGDLFSNFTLDPDHVKLGSYIASDLFCKEQLIEFSDLAYSRTNNLYKIKQENK
jgi:anaerobic magnesium-protoporphyrin IX monomethyl ester cyclase